MSKELKSYLSKKFEGRESFLENIVFPIFGEERFEDMYDVDALDNEDLQAMARRTGIKSAIQYGLVQVGTTEINIYDVTVSDRVMMRRNRVGIQQLIRRIMLDYTSAFIIFHYEDSDSWDWRFSFCQKDNKEVTEAKRYTFLLGPGQSCRTAADNFQKLIDKRGEISREDIVKAFDVEALSKEFFDKYKAQYEKFCNYIYDNCDDESLFGKEFAKWDEKLIRDYVKKLLGRIVFLHFLQKKGWLGVPFGKEWGEGDTQFMKHLFEASTQEQKENYLDCVLEPLFAGALNTQRPNDIFDLDVDGYRTTRIPYLNGGLFERDALDEPKSTLPASYFEELFDFFYQYNFTIDENDPNDAEVGIDPEMLGRIFENLLEDNKDKGAFYTPKEIVQYMCRESLIAYLTTCVMKKQGENHKPEDEIKESVRKLLNKPEEIVPRMTKEHLKDFDFYIRNVKICDPAIGSGAFPMGLLNELVRCRVFINAWAKDENGNLLEGDYAALKTEIISNNIYGVDIEKGAIDIARLRFWLSIIVDERNPHVLPNFDYKFMQGNSLIPTFDGKYINLDTKSQQHINVNAMRKEKQHLYELKQNYYQAEGEAKHDLNVQIKDTILKLISRQLGYESRAWYQHNAVQTSLSFDDVKNMPFDEVRQSLPEDKLQSIALAESLHAKLTDNSIPVAERSQIDIHFFDWRIMFTEVFDNGNDGFDIVIGNPPYVTYKGKQKVNCSEELVSHLISIYKDSAEYKINSYALFVELGQKISRSRGCLTFIIPSTILQNEYLKKIRKLLITANDLMTIVSFENKVFDAVTDSIIIECLHGHSTSNIMTYYRVNDLNFTCTDYKCFNPEQWNSESELYKIDLRSNNNDKIIFSKMEDNSIRLGDIYNVYVGIVANGIKKFLSEYKQNNNYKKYLQGKHLGHYSIKKTSLFINFDKEKLHSNTDETVYEREMKILLRKTGNVLIATIDKEHYYTDQSIYNIYQYIDNSYSDYLLVAILNSKLMNFYYNRKLITNADVFPYIKGVHIKSFPIPKKHTNSTIEKKIEDKVRKILDSRQKGISINVNSIECEINKLVYQLYGLTQEEISIVEGKNE